MIKNIKTRHRNRKFYNQNKNYITKARAKKLSSHLAQNHSLCYTWDDHN